MVALSGTGLGAMDLDGNGFNDLWERLYNAGSLTLDGDEDKDGMTNLEESIAGTDPFDASSRLRHSEWYQLPGEANFLLGWHTVPGKYYQVQSTGDMNGPWQEEGNPQKATGSLVYQVLLGGAEARKFYRVKVVEVDEDGDGLSAWEELLLGLDDTKFRSQASYVTGDFAAAMEMMEGTGTLALTNGQSIPRRMPGLPEASRLLAQCTYGSTYQEIEAAAATGLVAWIDQQLAMPYTSTYTMMWNNGQGWGTELWIKGWWRTAMLAPDQVRQRIGYSLSQIFVISRAGSDQIRGRPDEQARWYDMLLNHGGQGNFRDILQDVSYSPAMGLYLSHIKNRKADPALGRFPDENFAREIMQLFTIGLWELNPDGSQKLDPAGEPIPTYGNVHITELAKVFTGFAWGGPSNQLSFETSNNQAYGYPMRVWDDEHEPGEKHLVGGVIIPAGQTGDQDVAMALDALFNHPNVGPFIARRMIQRLVTSNPSPAYIRRVATVFGDNGAGVRGDMRAVARAILLDPDARNNIARGNPRFGRLKEPYLRYVKYARAFTARNSDNTYRITTPYSSTWFGQEPMNAPSVFNYYLPDFRPSGDLANEGLVAPEFQIATPNVMASSANIILRCIDRGYDPYYYGGDSVSLQPDYSAEIALAESGQYGALIDRLNILLAQGSMTDAGKQVLLTMLQGMQYWSAADKVEHLVYILGESPEGVILK